MALPRNAIFLGTVAIEPNRWGMVDAERRSTIDLAEHLDQIADAGFDGIEVWEDHLVEATDERRDGIINHRLDVAIYNTYVSFDDRDSTHREAVAANIVASGAKAVKYNVGNEPDDEAAYVERVESWLDALPETVAVICECHDGISIAEEPATAARIFDRIGRPDRVEALVHTHDDSDTIRAKFDAYGERITHVHVNELPAQQPPLADRRAELEATLGLLSELGFEGTFTLEFTDGVFDTDANPAVLVENAAADLAVLRSMVA